MTKLVQIHTPSRLHFGLLGWGSSFGRQFGGVGLMVEKPGLVVSARPSADWQARGPHAARVLEIAQGVGQRQKWVPDRCALFEIHQAPSEHAGLGAGTQLSLAVAQCLWSLQGGGRLEARLLAEFAQRSPRSGVGLHGFDRGGLVVDGGKKTPEGVPPLLAHQHFPPHWRILLVIPRLGPGRHGPVEDEAFRKLPPVPDALIDRLCRLVLLGILPAVAEADLRCFGAALAELQAHVGEMFAAAQGGRSFAHSVLEDIATALQTLGFLGVGQSSWGPTLYAFTDRAPASFAEPLRGLVSKFGLGEDSLVWTQASESGAVCLLDGKAC